MINLENLIEDNKALIEALQGLTTNEKDDPCWKDHHGYCQAHNLEEDCSMNKARKVLASLKCEY